MLLCIGTPDSPITTLVEIGVASAPVTDRGGERGGEDCRQRGGDRDMRCLVGRGAGADQPVINDRHDHDAAANADQTGEQPGAGAGDQPKANQPKHAHRHTQEGWLQQQVHRRSKKGDSADRRQLRKTARARCQTGRCG
jgi:hypothetical protein